MRQGVSGRPWWFAPDGLDGLRSGIIHGLEVAAAIDEPGLERCPPAVRFVGTRVQITEGQRAALAQTPSEAATYETDHACLDGDPHRQQAAAAITWAAHYFTRLIHLGLANAGRG